MRQAQVVLKIEHGSKFRGVNSDYGFDDMLRQFLSLCNRPEGQILTAIDEFESLYATKAEVLSDGANGSGAEETSEHSAVLRFRSMDPELRKTTERLIHLRIQTGFGLSDDTANILWELLEEARGQASELAGQLFGVEQPSIVITKQDLAPLEPTIVITNDDIENFERGQSSP